MALDQAAIKKAIHSALSDAPSRTADEADRLVCDLAWHVRLLVPAVEARTAGMSESLGALGAVVLRLAREALHPAAPSADRDTRLYDLGTAARALLALVDMTGGVPEACDEPEPTEPTGWLVVIGPQ